MPWCTLSNTPPIAVSAICNPISADLSGFTRDCYFFNAVMCTPDEITVQVKVPGVGPLLLVLLLAILTSWWCPVHQLSQVRGCDKVKRTFAKMCLIQYFKSGWACVFYAEKRVEMGLLHKVMCLFVLLFSRSICKHLRASLNYAAEPIFASLLWSKGFDCSQLA